MSRDGVRVLVESDHPVGDRQRRNLTSLDGALLSDATPSVARVAYFLCTSVHGPAWDDERGIRDQDAWAEHAAFMDRLVIEGVIIVGGPVGAGYHTAHLIESEDEATVRARLAGDPWAEDGHLIVGSLDSWSLWLDGRHFRTA